MKTDESQPERLARQEHGPLARSPWKGWTWKVRVMAGLVSSGLITALLVGASAAEGLQGSRLSAAAIGFRAASTGQNAPAATSLKLRKPAGVAPGDLLIAVVNNRGAPSIVRPAGWTLLGGTGNGRVAEQHAYCHVAASGDPSSWTWGFSASVSAAGVMTAYAGAETASASTRVNAAINSLLAPSASNSKAGGLLLAAWGTYPLVNISAPSRMTGRAQARVNGTHKVTLKVADQLLTRRGATGIRKATSSPSARQSIGQSIMLSPATGPSPSTHGSGWSIRGVPVYPDVISYWENSVRSAPLDPESANFISYWDSHSLNPSINLKGSTSGGVGKYSFATCYGTATDPLWTVTASKPDQHTFQVRCAPNDGNNLSVAPGDRSLVFFDLAEKQMLKIAGSNSGCTTSTHTCTGNYWNWRNWSETDAHAGLDAQYNPRCSLCRGHRGLDSSVFGILYDEAAKGSIPHVLKITLPSTVNSSGYVYPYVAGEGGKTGIIPEGTRVRLTQAAYERLRPTITNPAARTMLDALYQYGALTSDSGSDGINIKLENGNGYDWSKLGISSDSLSSVKVTDFEVVQRGWDEIGVPSRSCRARS